MTETENRGSTLSSRRSPPGSSVDSRGHSRSGRKGAADLDAPPRVCLFVLGMHRSGTSSIAGTFVKLGAAAPRTMLGANEGNAAGHWESEPLIQFHDELLASAGSRWDDWREFNPAWYDTPVAAQFKARGKELLRQEFGDSPLFVFKDPRNCRLVRFWLDIFAEEGITAKIVLPVRSPLEVAQSHRVRDAFPLRKGLLLWLRHVLDAESASRELPRAVVEWRSFLQDWQASIASIEQALGPFPANTDLAGAKVDRFLADDLRHQRVSEQELADHAVVHDWVRQAYDALRELSRNPGSNSARAELDQVRQQFETAAPLFGGILADAEASLSEMTEKVQALSGQLAAAPNGDTQNQLEATRAELQALADQFNRERQQGVEQAAQLTAALQDAEARVQAASEEAAAQMQQLGAAQAELQVLTDQLNRERQLGTEQSAQFAAALQDAEARVQAASAEAASQTLRLEAVQAELQALTDLLAKEREQGAESAAQLAAALQGAEARIQAASEEAAAQTQQLEAAQAELQVLTDQLNQERQQSTQQAAQLVAALQDAEARVHAASEDAAAQALRLEAVQAELQSLTDQLAKEREQGAESAAQFAAALQEAEARVQAAGTEAAAREHALLTEHWDATEKLQSEYNANLERRRVVAESAQLELEDLKRQIDAEREGQERLRLDLEQRIKELSAQHQAAELRYAADLSAAVEQREYHRRQHDEDINRIFQSRSWRLTAPLRWVGRILRYFGELRRRSVQRLKRLALSVWRHLPLPAAFRRRIKDGVFVSLPFLFRGTVTYDSWHVSRQVIRQGENSIERKDDRNSSAGPEYVPLLVAQPPAQKAVRTIAFYLPQFHRIPENDQWWGSGFTEWTNVRPATPQFEGHYQPHVPGELGYYDLLDKSVQRRQIELAKLYGIEGFCFYFYWFGGKRLLEKPIENWLEDKSLDLPFCLCWANENWSRRWDGLDSEILIAQNYSPEDDLSFIAEVAPYLRDSRYIRVDGKPLLLVYRPNLLPSARDTAYRWREWCRQNGVGEIYLAYTQSFEAVDPQAYGFDAAVEFPPNNSAPPDVTNSIPKKSADFGGTIYDWSIFLERSRAYRDPGYEVFHSVCPGWDNTARRKCNGTIFVGNNPGDYQSWLENAIADTIIKFHSYDKRLVFVNAWNEWAEGAHLEPDERFGYAFLQATRNAVGKDYIEQESSVSSSVAIVVHAFYPEILDEIVEYIEGLPRTLKVKLFVTTVPEKRESVYLSLRDCGRDFFLDTVENRGRDVLPFFDVLPRVISEGYAYVIKVHTKKSLHRGDGAEWRGDMYRKLLSGEFVQGAIRAFEYDKSLGLVGPSGHYVSMTTYLGSNESRIMEIGESLGLSRDEILATGFYAGTMFMARVSAIMPLERFVRDRSKFEPEEGQTDGTFAHAAERCFSLSVKALGMRMQDIDFLGDGRGPLPAAKTEYEHA